ncbi:MAG: MCE family protein [Mycobacteriaceae bacterium]|nr:MCE family protein [Mycobacteriaceae bacterium]
MKPSVARPLLGLVSVLVVLAIVFVAINLFRGGFTTSEPVTVISDRAGLVINPDARVKMRGVQVGKVASIQELPDGRAAIHLAMDPSQMRLIPSNVLVDIASTTVFGAKYVQFIPPPHPSPQPLTPGKQIDAGNVTVEINTVFQQLTQLLSTLEPDKLNETLGAIATALNGRGQKIGQTLADLDAFFDKSYSSLPAFRHDLQVAPQVLDTYADAAPDLLDTARNATTISQTLVDEQNDLDAFLVSAIGLADIGNDVIGTNRQALTDVLHLLVPTTDLLNEYNPALTCALQGIAFLTHQPPLPLPGIVVSVSFTWGIERYRYPTNLPKVAATGGPQCDTLPDVPKNSQPKFVITDNGTNPEQYGNPGILLNSDGLKQLLYGPVAGPPRNSPQIGMPG